VSLLAAARNANDCYLSEKLVDRMKKDFPHLIDSLISASVLLANVYASSGDFDKSLTIRNELNQSGHKKKIGSVWTEKNGQIFVSHNQFIY